MPLPSPSELLNKIQGGSTAPLFSTSSKIATTPIPTPDSVLSASRKGSSQPSFISNIATAGIGFAKKAASAIGGFIGTQASNVASAVTGETRVSPADVLDGIKQTGAGITMLAQGFNEGVARIAKSASLATLGPELTAKIGKSPVGDFGKVATGRQNTIDVPGVPQPEAAGEPLISYQDIFKKAHSYALENNANLDQANTFAGLTVIGMMFADNPLIGPEAAGAKGAFKVSAKAAADLAEATTDDAVKAILKLENPKLGDNVLEMMTPVFRDAKTVEEVKHAADEISKVEAARIVEQVSGERDVPNPDEVLKASTDNLAPESRATAAPVADAARVSSDVAPETSPFFRAIPEGDTVKFSPVEGQPVKIADGLETFIHQPENGAYEVLESSTGRILGKPSATPAEAIQTAKEAIQGRTPEEIQAQLQAHTKAPVRESAGVAPGTQQALRLEERGLSPAQAPRPFDTQLIRSISQEETSGPILERLTKEFPHLSNHALAPIAERLAGLKRTADIEGILQVVRNISNDIGKARAASRGPIAITRDTLERSIAKVNTKAAIGDLPPSIGELLTNTERGRYLDNVQRAIKDKEQAVLAKQEYDALWEHADQRILDRFEELQIYKDILEEQMNTHPGKSISALYRGTFISPEDTSLDQLIASKPKLGIDSKVGEIMQGQMQPGVADTVAQGQKALEDFRQMRTELEQLKSEIRELRPKAKAARLLQSMVEDVPVIARERAGEIEALANFEDVRKYKDISGFTGQAKDVYRIFERVFGEKYPAVKKAILDPFDRSKGAMVDELKAIGDDLDKNVVRKLGIKRGSKLSAAVQRYGDSSLPEGERWGFDRLISELGSADAAKVIEAEAFFRERYNSLIDRVNKVRADIYPNDPSKLIPKRKDYYRHFQELGDGFKALMDIFESPSGIDPKLAGLSEWTLPKSKFLSFAQERIGKDSTIDAVGGFIDYAPSFAYAVHIDPHIGNFRYLRRRLSESAPTPGVRELVPAANKDAAEMGAQDLVKQPGINNFLTFLDNYANDLAGKTNPMDRYLQMVIPGGRATMRAIDWINARVKSNTILGNLSSAVAQIFNVPNGIGSAKLYSIPGMQRTLSSIFIHDDALAASSFIKERYMQPISSRFNVDWVEHPVRGTTERGKEIAAWITGALDEVGTKFIWQSHYAKALAEGATDPVKYADDVTRKMVAGRGVGEVPLLQKSKIFKLVAPFQLEVGNAWHVLGDMVRRKDFGGVATVIVANYLFNRAAEEIRGTPVVYDPIQAFIDGATDASDEMNDNGNAGRAAFKFAGRQVGEVLSNMPFGQTVAASPITEWVVNKAGLEGGTKELFGSGDPSRFGGGLLAVKGLTDPLYKILLPFGGSQIKRTKQGVEAMLTGEVRDSSGKLSYISDRTPATIAQAVLFGKNGTSESRDFFNTRDDLFKRIYRQDANRTEIRLEAEAKWKEVKALSTKDEKVKALQALDKSDPQLAEAIAGIAKDEALGLSGTDRLIKMLGVENGERAKYISDTVSGMDTRQQQVAYLKDLDDKKLISDPVFEQLMVLLKGKIKKQ